MRFLVLTQYFRPEIGAPQTRLLAFCRELRRRGHDVEVVTAMPNYPEGRIAPAYRGRLYLREEQDGIPVHRVWLYPAMGQGLKRMLNYGTFSLFSLFGLLKARRPDVLFVESPPLFVSVAARAAARWWNIPFIFNVADLWPDAIREIGRLADGPVLRALEALERWSYRKAAYVNAVTTGIHTALLEEKGLPPDKVLFLPNGADIELFRPAPPDRDVLRSLSLEGRKAIVYAGNIGYAQGLGVALRAMRRLADEHPEVVLVIVGDGSEKPDLIEMARREQLENVLFLEPRPLDYVARLYSVAYAGFASLIDLPLHEGARPSKILPVMASGKPILYSAAGEGARLIRAADAGLVTPPGDDAALAGAIRALVADPEEAARLGANGRRYVVEHLSWGVLVGDWLDELCHRLAPSVSEPVRASAERAAL